MKDYFTVSEFLDENWEKVGGNIFLGGKLSFLDQKLNDDYELTPVGLLRQFVPRRHMPNATEYNVQMAEFWYKTISSLPELPNVDKVECSGPLLWILPLLYISSCIYLLSYIHAFITLPHILS